MRSLRFDSPQQAADFMLGKMRDYASEQHGNAVIVTYRTVTDSPCAALYIGSGHKAKEHIRFRDDGRRELAINAWKTQIDEAAKRREAVKAEKKERLQNFKMPFKVGDVLCASWGYDQTNVDYVVVMEILGRRDVLVQNCGQKVEREAGWASEYVVPDSTNLLGKPYRKRVNIDGSIDLHGGFGYARKWEGGSDYQSHYA